MKKHDQGSKSESSLAHVGRRVFRLLVILLLSLVVLIAGLLIYITHNLEHLTVDLLTSTFQRPVSLGSLHINPWGYFEIKDFKVANPTWARQPNWIEIKRVSGQINLELLLTGQLYFVTLFIQEPVFTLEILENDTTNIPGSEPGSSPNDETSDQMRVQRIFRMVQAERFELNAGRFDMWLPEEELELHVPAVKLSGRRIDRDQYVYETRLQLDAVHLTMVDIMDVTASLTGERLIVDAAGVTLSEKPLFLQIGHSTRLEATRGRLTNFAYPDMDFEVKASLDLNDIATGLLVPVAMNGTADLRGTVKGLADKLIVLSELDLKPGANLWKITYGPASAQLSYQDGTLSTQKLSLVFADGQVKGQGHLHFLDQTDFAAELDLQSCSLGIIQHMLERHPLIDGIMAGQVQFQGNDYDLEHMRGKVQLDCQFRKENNQHSPKMPLIKGDYCMADLVFERGKLDLKKLTAQILATSLDFKAQLSQEGQVAGSYQVQSSDLSGLYTLITKTFEGKVPKQIHAQLNQEKTRKLLPKRPQLKQKILVGGQGKLEGTISGPISSPDFEARLECSPISIETLRFETLTAHIGLVKQKAYVYDFQARQGEMLANLSGNVDLITLAKIDTSVFSKENLENLERIRAVLPQFKLETNVRNFPLDQLAHLFTGMTELEGMVNLNAALENKTHLDGTASMLLRNLNLFGQRIFQIQANLAVDQNQLSISPLKNLFFDADKGLSEIVGRASLDNRGYYSMDLSTGRLSSNLINSLEYYQVPFSGVLAGSISGEGSIHAPKINASFTVYDVHLHGTPLGIAQMQFDLNAQTARINASLLEQGIQAVCELNLEHKTIETAELALSNTNIVPYFKLMDVNLDSFVGRTTGKAEIMGNYAALEQIDARVILENFSFGLPDYPLQNANPVIMSLDQGHLSFQPVTMVGERSQFYLSGELDLMKDFLRIGAEGELDLELLTSLEPEIKYAQGISTIGLNIEGTFERPYYFVEGLLYGGVFVLREVPLEFKDIDLVLVMNNQVIDLNQGSAALGTGLISLTGGALLPDFNQDFDPFATELDLTIEGQNLQIDYPDGFEGEIATELSVSKTLLKPHVNGFVHIHRNLYEADINIRAILLDILREALLARPQETAASTEVLFNPTFNIDIKSVEPITVVSDDLISEFRTDISLAGDLLSPRLQGNLEVESGQINFDDRVLNIETGLISFLNPKGFYPTFDVQAESEIQGYTISVNLTGEYPDFILSFNSDQDLTKNQILSLLLTGQLNLEQGGSGTDEYSKFAQDIVLSNVLDNEIINRVKELFAIDKFQVVPVSGTGAAGSWGNFQITAGTEISGWYITTTITPDSTDYNIISVERELSRRLSIEMFRNTDNSYSVDLRFRFPFP
ncbi:translocation/assembly module TamB domain-containing protein [bacterium]|nr:translocation/assembly module TamB domain-containing protein [bacterium]